MTSRALRALAVLLPVLEARAAPRPAYGGRPLLHNHGAPVSLDPARADGSADRTLTGLVYEALFTLDRQGQLLPVLAAEVPEASGMTLAILLAPGVELHDGRTLDAALVAEALSTRVQPGERAAYPLLPIQGVLERLAGQPAPLGLRAEGQKLVLQLREPYPEVLRLLASPRAALGFAPRPGAAGRAGGVGSGPFTPEGAAEGGLLPFLGHREGRPFLDGLLLRESRSRFGAVTQLKRGEAAVIFGVPDPRAVRRPELLLPEDSGRELLYLLVGSQRPPLASPEGLAAISAALDRETLARRFLGGGAEPAVGLLAGPAQREPAAPLPPVEARMLAAREDPLVRRAAERVQLELLSAGVSATIEWTSPEELARRRRDGAFDLLLDCASPDRAVAGSAADRLHEALSLAAVRGAGGLLDAEEWRRFARADEAGRQAQLAALEPLLRRRAGLVPLAWRPVRVAVSAELFDVRPDGFGRLDLAWARKLAGAR